MDDEIARKFLECPELRFYKHPEAAGCFLLAVSDELLAGRELPLITKIELGQVFREAALLAIHTHTEPNKKAAGEVLLKSLGLKKGGSEKYIEKAKRAKAANQEIADWYNVGKNEVQKKLEPMEISDRERLGKKLSHTVSVLLRVVGELGSVADSSEVSKRLRNYLEPQFRLLDENELVEHIHEAMREAKAKGLIEDIGRDIKLTL